MNSVADERLLRAVAEELRLPLVRIVSQCELESREGSLSEAAHMALKLVDGFLLSARLQAGEDKLLEPVSLSSALAEAAHRLAPLARKNNCDLVLSLDGKYGPALAHRESLEMALLLLGQGIIEGWTGGEPRRREVVLGLHRSPSGLVAGVFDDQPGLSAQGLRRGQQFYGRAGQAMPAVASNSAAGIFVADSLMRSMSAYLYVSRHHKRTGLAAAFRPSQQLRLV